MKLFWTILILPFWISTSGAIVMLTPTVSNPTLATTSNLPLSPSPSPATSFANPTALLPQSSGAPALTTPGSLLDLVGDNRQQKWHITTYYTCLTLGGKEDCGIHEPVRPGGTEIAGAPLANGNAAGVAVAAAALVMAALLQ